MPPRSSACVVRSVEFNPGGLLRFLAVSGILALVLARSESAAKPTPPVGLLVDGMSAPLAVDREAVEFTWRSDDAGRGARQTAYEILVATRVDRLDRGAPDCWDTGKVTSGRSAAIAYAGQPLPSAARFWWQVRTWDEKDQPGDYSAPAFFDTGLTNGEWTAQYLWDGTNNLNNFAYFRKTFALSAVPHLAKVYVTAHNDYLLYVNGQPVGRGPARCDPYFNGQYNAYDITGLLKAGVNVLAAEAHWLGTWINSGVNAEPAFLLQAKLAYADGHSTNFGTDPTWKVLAHTGFIETEPVFFSDRNENARKKAPRPGEDRPEPAGGWISDLDNPQWAAATVVVRSGYRTTYTPYGGAAGSRNRAAIQFDGRAEPAGWQAPGFDDSKWAAATAVDRSDYHLYAQKAPLVHEQAELEPERVVQKGDAWLVDFGRCINGWPKLTLRANRTGDVLRVEYFQMPDERKPAGWDRYICRTGTETWKPDFGRHASFRVLKITGYAGPLRPADIHAMWAYCDVDPAGRFHCSNPLLNDIYEMCVRSARQNTQQGIISVDANREQSQWTADSWNIGNVLLYNNRNTTEIDKIVRDCAVEQLPNGNFPACCPAQRSRCIPEWAMYWPMLLWQQYLFSGADSLLREMAPRLTRFLAWMRKYQDPKTKLVDPPGWRISEYAGGNLPNGGYNIATACQYYENLRIASALFSTLGNNGPSAAYAEQAQELASAINARLFNERYYLARTDRTELYPLASAWALRFNLVPAAAKPGVLAAILAPGKPNLGGYGGDAFYSGLLNAGAGDFVVRDLERYRPMLEGNRTNWESFNPGGGEANHAWTAYPGYLFQKYICGIQPTSGAFATFDVRPEIGGLTFAEGTVPTVKGDITSRWEKTMDGRLSLALRVPANTRASIYLPVVAADDVAVSESGRQIWPGRTNVAGLVAVQKSGDRILCVVDAGSYLFECRRLELR